MTEFVAGPTMDALPPEAAPKRRGRPPKDPNAPRKPRQTRSRVNLKEQVGGTLVLVNMAIASIPLTARDALDVKELELLVDAIDNQCKISPTFRKYVMAATSVTQGGQLIGVLALIGARRLSRHGFLPAETDAAIGAMIGAAELPPVNDSTPRDETGAFAEPLKADAAA